MKRVMPFARNFVLLLIVVLVASAIARADDAKSPGVAGKWTWEQTRPDGDNVTVVLTLKQDGENVTGTFHGRGPDSEIFDGHFHDGKLSFKVDREIEGHKVTLSYSGKVEGDIVKGEVVMKVLFHEQSQPWEAKREKAE